MLLFRKLMVKTVALTWLFSYMFCCVFCGTEENVVVRRRAHEGEFPYVVCIQRKASWCGGILVKLNVVLTAASCFIQKTELNKRTFVVIAGSIDLADRELQTIEVSSFIKHKDYVYLEQNSSVEIHHDIGLVKLVQNFIQNPNVKPYVFPFSTPEKMKDYLLKAAKGGRRCLTLGYGFLKQKNELATHLDVVEINILTKHNCSRLTDALDPVICTKAVKKDDSPFGEYGDFGKGNPMICGGKVLAIDQGVLVESDSIKILFTPIWPYLKCFKLPMLSSGYVSVQNVGLQTSLLTLAVINIFNR